MKLVRATELKKGDTILMTFGRRATLIKDPVIGSYVAVRTERGVSRYNRYDDVTIQEACEYDAHQAHVDINGGCPVCGATA